MKSKLLAAALLGTALLSGVAYAQTATPDRSNANTAVHKDGQWRASKLIGVNVYNDNNDKIGEVQELIVDKSSKVDNVVLGDLNGDRRSTSTWSPETSRALAKKYDFFAKHAWHRAHPRGYARRAFAPG